MRAVHEAVRLALHENNTKLLQHCLVCHRVCVCVVYMLIVHVNVYMHVMCTCVYCAWSLVYPPRHVLCVSLSRPPHRHGCTEWNLFRERMQYQY